MHHNGDGQEVKSRQSAGGAFMPVSSSILKKLHACSKLKHQH